jgi:hypothetical protein
MVLSLQHRSSASSLWLAGVVSFGEGATPVCDGSSTHRAEGITRPGSIGRRAMHRSSSVANSSYRAARKPCPVSFSFLQNGLDSRLFQGVAAA